MNDTRLITELLDIFNADPSQNTADRAVSTLLAALEAGSLRCAVPDGDTWNVDIRVKQLILWVFRRGYLEEKQFGPFQFCDKHNLWPCRSHLADRNIRLVPGATTVRPGAFLANRVTIMSPAYINIGAWIDEDTLIDSHALVGSCAQVGKRCHISAAAQLGGVIEPVGQLPVIVEDDAFIGGNCGIYEGTRVRSGAVVASGTILTRSTPVFDLVHETTIRAENGVLTIPPNAVVVPGSRAVRSRFGSDLGLSIYAPMIVKYRDDKTDASTLLEAAIRPMI